MDRRDVLEAFPLAILSAPMTAFAADDAVPTHEHHHDHGAMGGKYSELIASTSHCIGTGDTRLAHCIMLLGDGDDEKH